jgi:hypothetical protein
MDLIKSITDKMQRAKEYWTEKTAAMRVLWNDISRG